MNEIAAELLILLEKTVDELYFAVNVEGTTMQHVEPLLKEVYTTVNKYSRHLALCPPQRSCATMVTPNQGCLATTLGPVVSSPMNAVISRPTGATVAAPPRPPVKPPTNFPSLPKS